MNPLPDRDEIVFARRLQLSVARHSLFWLVAANFVGVWLALVLVRPQWGNTLGEFSYGRWMPLHLNWQLYGWCSLPVVGVLLRRFLPATAGALLQARWILQLWTMALIVGGWCWLHGESSGKLFLDWSGVSRVTLLAVLIALWLVLAWNYWVLAKVRATRSALVITFETILLILLAAIPGILCWSSGRDVYPPIDPGTGGPTGMSLLGSTLVIVLVIGSLPTALSMKATHPNFERVYWACLCLHELAFWVLRKAPASHTNWQQIVGLGSLLIWAPLGGIYLWWFPWRPDSKKWLTATVGWWALLILSGFVTFLPGVLENFKFTDALVAHAHVAMGGLLTSLNVLVLANLTNTENAAADTLGHWTPFLGWHAALIVHLLALSGLAAMENKWPGRFFAGGTFGLNSARFLAGLAMSLVSMHWLSSLWRAGNV